MRWIIAREIGLDQAKKFIPRDNRLRGGRQG